VAKVLPDSPAQAAGIQVGDVIVKFNNHEVMNSANLPPIVGSSQVGVKLPVEVVRNTRTRTIMVTLGELPEEGEEMARATAPETVKANRLGITARALTEQEMSEAGVGGGVAVAQVTDGAAARAGLRKDDIILSVDNKEVTGVAQFNTLIESLEPGKTVALLVQRGGNPTFLALRVPGE
jgi:serine protease Do